MTQHVLDRPVVALPTYEAYMTDVIQRGWLPYYEQAILEVAQSAQRSTRSVDLRSDHHLVSAKDLEGIPVACVNRFGFMYIVHEMTEASPAQVVSTVVPWYIAVQLTYPNFFFASRLERVGQTLYTSQVVISDHFKVIS